jgi:Lamin Tail Domain
MPELTARGDLFGARAGAGFDEGYVGADVGVGIRGSFGASAEFCHGIDLGVNAEAVASALVDLKLLWFLVGKAEGFAIAGAGAEAKAKVDINLFETAGVSAAAKAYAEASIAGRLSVTLTAEDAAKLARDYCNNLGYDIFIALLNEISGGGGVWGKLAAAATAKAEAEVICSLKDDDDSGCVVTASAEAGLAAGGGYGFYIGFTFAQPKRFFLYAAERVAREFVGVAKSVVPRQFQPAIDYLELLLPFCLSSAYEIGQHNAKVFDDPAACVKLFVDCFSTQAQRFALDKVTDFGLQQVNDLLRASIDEIASASLSDAERERAVAVIDGLITLLQHHELHLNNLNELIEPLGEVLELVLPAHRPEWELGLSIVWFALAAVEAIRYGFETAAASASASFLGLTTAPASGQVITLIQPPPVVRDTFRDAMGYVPAGFGFGDALDFIIIKSGALDRLVEVLPRTRTLFEALASTLGIAPRDILRLVLTASLGGNITTTEFYRKVREFIVDGIDNYVEANVISRLRRDARNDPDLLLYVDKVVEPAFLVTRNFVFSRLDMIVAAPDFAGDAVFSKTFSTALSSLLFKLVTANFLVLTEIVFNHVLDNLHDGLRQLGQRIRSSPPDRLVDAIMQHLVQPLLPPFVDRSEVEPAGRKLAANLCEATAIGLGPAVISHQRRTELFDAINQSIRSIDNSQQIVGRPSAVDDLMEELCECFFIPDQDGLDKLFRWQTETLSRSLSTAAPLYADALSVFMIEVTAKKVQELEDAARAFVFSILEAVRALWEAYQRFVTALNDAIAWAQQTAVDAANALRAASNALKGSSVRNHILAKLEDDGEKEARRQARHAPGYDLLNADGKKAARDLAAAGFRTAFDLAWPILEVFLEILGQFDGVLADALSSATSFSNLVRKIIDGITGDITNAFPGLANLSEIHPEAVINAIEDSLKHYSPLSDALKAALQAAQNDQAAQRAKDRAAEKKDAAYLAHQQKLEEQKNIVGVNVNIHIESPMPFFHAGRYNYRDWMYGRDLPVWISIEGARPSFVSPGSPQRVFLALNGNEVRIPDDDWFFDGKALLLRTILSPPAVRFKSGINILECSVTSGAEGQAKRSKVAFCMCQDLTSPPGIAVADKISVFNSPSNDHYTVKQECVALKNMSSRSISLGGWRLLDRKNHVYDFRDIAVAPKATIEVHTGPGRDAGGKYYWGRKRAVWNNDGDFVFLINPDRILSYCYLYLPKERKR